MTRRTWVWSSPRMDGRIQRGGIEDPAAHFNGKTIRVRGVVVIRKENRPYIEEVNDPSQIEMVE